MALLVGVMKVITRDNNNDLARLIRKYIYVFSSNIHSEDCHVVVYYRVRG